MITLGLDASGAACAAAIIEDGDVRARQSETIGRGHAERLAGLTQAALSEAGLEPAALDRIGVIAGPGAFTGLRVGVAFARGLGLTLGVPALGLSALEVWARAVNPDGDRPVLAAHDARRGDLAWAVYGPGQRSEMRLTPISEAADAARALNDPIVTGSGAALLGAALGQTLTASGPPDIVLTAKIAAARHDLTPALPLYQRPPDAKLPGGVDPA